MTNRLSAIIGALLLLVAGLGRAQFVPGTAPVFGSGGSGSSSSSGVDTNAVIALIQEYGGGGITSNAVVELTVDTWYTNGPDAAIVEAQVELPNSAATMLFCIKDTNSAVTGYLPGSAAWNEFGNAAKYAFQTSTATEDNVQSLGGYVPPFAAFRYYKSGTTAAIYDNAPNGTRILYFGTNGASGGGGGSGVSAAQVAAIMQTNTIPGSNVVGTLLVDFIDGDGSGLTNLGFASGAYDLLYASNGPSRLRAEWRQRRLMPPLMTASYNVFATSSIEAYTNDAVEARNYMRWATNVLYFHSTNGMRASGYDYVQIDDGWQWRTNGAGATDLVNGTTTWNTNVFPMGMVAYCDLAHSLGMKVVGYTSFTTNTCNTNGVGSPIHRVYRDVQTFMSWGWDGVKFDTCADDLGSAYLNREYLKRYFRVVNQAIDDYYAIVQATNGTCREFIIGTPLVYQVMDPDQSTVTADVMDHVDWVFLNWNALSVALEENYIENIRTMAHVAMKLEPLLPPGKAVGMESFYNLTPGGGYTLGKWTNVLSMYAAMAAPMIGRFATWDYGTITNAAGEPPAENGGSPIYQLKVTGVYWTNQAFLNVLRDPAGIRSSLVWSNQGVEMWRRPLGSPDFSKDCFVTFSAATNSSLYHAATGATNITVSFNDFGGRPGYRYARTDIWTGIVTEFTDSFTVNLTTNSVQSFRITKQQEFNYLSSGVANSSLSGTLVYYHPVSAAVNASQNAIAYRVPEDIMLGEFTAHVTYAAAIDTNSFVVFTNLAATPLKVSVVVGTATSVNNISTATTNVPVYIPAGTMLSIGATNQSGTSRAIFGGWSLKYLNPKR